MASLTVVFPTLHPADVPAALSGESATEIFAQWAAARGTPACPFPELFRQLASEWGCPQLTISTSPAQAIRILRDHRVIEVRRSAGLGGPNGPALPGGTSGSSPSRPT